MAMRSTAINGSGRRALILAVIALLLAGVALVMALRPKTSPGASGNATYDRVISSGTLRVGYVAYPPASIVDPSTKAVSGIFPDLVRRIGKLTSLKVEFVQETTYADMVEGLNSGKFDIVGGVWANPNRGKMTMISTPVYYTGVNVWVRPGETRFGPADGWRSLNDPAVRIAAIDGSTPLNIANEQFPHATLRTYPNTASESQLFLDLTQGKVDVFFAEPAQGLRYLAANPGAIKSVGGSAPLRLFASVFLLPKGEVQLKTLVDTALQELQSSGEVDATIGRYEPQSGVFLRVARPYQSPGVTSR